MKLMMKTKKKMKMKKVFENPLAGVLIQWLRC